MVFYKFSNEINIPATNVQTSNSMKDLGKPTLLFLLEKHFVVTVLSIY